jgi:peroxiredoxin
MGTVAGAVVFVVIAVVGGKGRRKRPLFAAIGCLATALVMATANYALIFLVQLPSLALEQQREHQDRIDAVSFVHAGDPAPSFRLTDTNGHEFDSDNQRGKVVMVSFFATWCGPCLQEFPHLQKLWDNNRDNADFGMIVIGREETNESVSAFQLEHGYSFPMASDPDRSVYSLYAKELIPRTYLLSPDGIICFASTGFYEEDMTNLQAELAKQLRSTR